MSLTTTCPSCQTVFKVVPDQLKLRRGLVRCGTCQRVFNGLEALRPWIEPAAAPRKLPEQPVLFQELADAEPDLNTAFFLPEYESEAQAEAFKPAPDVHTLPLFNEAGAVVTPAIRIAPNALPGPAASTAAASSAAASTSAATSAPRYAAPLEEEVDAVDFFAGGSSEQPTLVRSLSRWAPWFIGMLLLALCLQVALAGRHWIVGMFPALRNQMEPALQSLGLDLNAPRDLDVLTLSSAEIRAQEQTDQFQLSALLVNRSRHAVHWPALMLILNSPQGDPLVRRVIKPESFIDPALLKPGMRANSEQDIRITFSTQGIKLGEYTLSLFYP